MKILLIISIMFVGSPQPLVQSETMDNLEQCIAKAHKELLAAETDLTAEEKKKIVGYGAQCVIMLPKGDDI